MAGYIIQDREQMLTLPARQVDALLDLSDGDAALLYLCLMRVEGAVTPEQLMEKLHLSALRLQAAQTKLEKLGLIRAQALPVRSPCAGRRSLPTGSWGTCCGTANFKCWWRRRSGPWAKSSPPWT